MPRARIILAATAFLLLTAQLCAAATYPIDKAVVNSIQDGSYLPCDHPNKYGVNDCAWGYAALAERKIVALEKDITVALKGRATADNKMRLFTEWQKQWRSSRDASCRASNRLADLLIEGQSGIASGGSDLSSGFCTKRWNEQRIQELEALLSLSSAEGS